MICTHTKTEAFTETGPSLSYNTRVHKAKKIDRKRIDQLCSFTRSASLPSFVWHSPRHEAEINNATISIMEGKRKC